MVLKGPKSFAGHRTHISINAGKAIPRADRQNAPKSEMNRPSLGIVIAKKTEIIERCSKVAERILFGISSSKTSVSNATFDMFFSSF